MIIIYKDDWENGIQGIYVFVAYFLFSVLKQLKQIDLSILYKLSNSLFFCDVSKLLVLFIFGKEIEWLSFNSFLEGEFFILSLKYLFLPNIFNESSSVKIKDYNIVYNNYILLILFY